MEEIWKVYKDSRIHPTKGHNQYNGHLYEVSNFGRVKVDGIIHIFDDTKFKNKYYSIAGFLVHRAVAELFIPNPENKPCIDHIDTNIHNNHVSNLRWATYSENSNNPISLEKSIKSAKARVNDEFRDFMRQINLGRKQSEERRMKTSEMQKGHRNYTKGYHWIHLIKEEKFVHEDYLDYWLDDGWVYGHAKGIHTAWNKGKHTGVGEENPAYGKHWYTNGIDSVLAFECPEGYIKGHNFGKKK